MFLIPQQIPWTKQPQVAVEVRKDSPFAIGLRRVYLPTTPDFDLIAHVPLTYYGTGRRFSVGENGVCLFSDTTTATVGIPLWTDTTGEASVVILQKRNSIANNGWLELGDSGIVDHFGYANKIYTDAFISGSRWVNEVPLDGLPYTSDHTIVITVKNGAQKLYFNGTTLTTNTLGSGFSVPAEARIGGSATFQGFDGNTYLVLFYDRYLSATEVKVISENPWQIFQTHTDYLFIPSVSGGGPASITGTLSSTLDSITTAIQGSLGHSSTLSISLDTIAVTGSGVLNHTGTSTSTLDDVVVTFSGAVDTAGSVSGTMAFTLDSIAFSSAGNLSHSTTIAFTLDDIFVSLSGTVAGTPENIDGTVSIVLDGIGFTSSGNSGTLTLTEDDINAIMTAIINNPKTLTVPKFLGLK